jgi:hypothetical protein
MWMKVKALLQSERNVRLLNKMIIVPTCRVLQQVYYPHWICFLPGIVKLKIRNQIANLILKADLSFVLKFKD